MVHINVIEPVNFKPTDPTIDSFNTVAEMNILKLKRLQSKLSIENSWSSIFSGNQEMNEKEFLVVDDSVFLSDDVNLETTSSDNLDCKIDFEQDYLPHISMNFEKLGFLFFNYQIFFFISNLFILLKIILCTQLF